MDAPTCRQIEKIKASSPPLPLRSRHVAGEYCAL